MNIVTIGGTNYQYRAGWEAEQHRPDGIIRLEPVSKFKALRASRIKDLRRAFERPDNIERDFTQCEVRSLFRAHKAGL